MLDLKFPPYSPGSRHLSGFEGRADQALLTAELRRTLAAIVAAAPGRIAKGQLSRADADRQIVLWGALVADLEAQDAWLAERARGIAPRQTLLAALDEISGCYHVGWQDKVAGLRHEIEARRRGYEAAIAKGQLTAETGRQQLERLEAVHDLYWRHGFAFDGTRDELRALSDAVLDADLAAQDQAVVQQSRHDAGDRRRG